MIASQNKPYYKVISLFIKSVILFLSFYYIYDKLNQSPMILDLPVLFSAENSLFTSAIFILMFVNWGLEAFKWKLLIAPLEMINFQSAVKGVLAGVTISIFTPNRVGEFAGRIFFLERSDKIQATVMSLIGSFIQLSITVIAGVLAFFVLEKKYYDFFLTEQFVSTDLLLLIIVLFGFFAGIVLYIFLKKRKTSGRFAKYIETFKKHSQKSLNVIFYLSVIRYIVFSVQYYFALRVFGINGGLPIVFSLIALTFFVTSVIPTFALTEIAVRSGVAIYFFSTISFAHAPILAASLFLWIINLAFPALIGSVFVYKLKFFKEQ